MALSTPTILGTPECLWPAGAALGEGTVWSQREQALYWIDILEGRLHRHDPRGGERRSWQFDEEITALAERAEAPGLIVTMRRGFALFDPALDASPRYLHRPEPERAGNRFNDGKCDRQGRFWAGSMDFDCRAPTGALYRFDADGSCTRHDDGFAVTNGPTWSLDERTMYFNATVEGCIYAYDFDAAAGTVRNKRVWLRFGEGEGLPDGMTTDAAGRLWIARWGGHCVSCHDPESGAELARITLPASQVTDCAFGGEDLCTLYISTARTGLSDTALAAEPLAGGLFSVRIGSPGLPAALFAG